MPNVFGIGARICIFIALAVVGISFFAWLMNNSNLFFYLVLFFCFILPLGLVILVKFCEWYFPREERKRKEYFERRRRERKEREAAAQNKPASLCTNTSYPDDNSIGLDP